jgi:hypothetical protein
MSKTPLTPAVFYILLALLSRERQLFIGKDIMFSLFSQNVPESL